MPRVTFVKKARKAQDQCGKCGAKIKKGEAYRWWKFRYGGRRIRCGKSECAPRASDLTQSPFYGQLYDIQDSVEEAIATRDKDSIAEALRNAAEELRSMAEECEEKRGNMPEGLQESETGELLQTRTDECNEKADELESRADELDNEEIIEPEEWEAYAESEGITKDDGESDDEFEGRVRDLIDEANENVLDVDVDLSIS